MEIAWQNFVHETFRTQNTKALRRQKNLLLDISEKESPVSISESDQLSPRFAKAYAGMHPALPCEKIKLTHYAIPSPTANTTER